MLPICIVMSVLLMCVSVKQNIKGKFGLFSTWFVFSFTQVKKKKQNVIRWWNGG